MSRVVRHRFREGFRQPSSERGATWFMIPRAELDDFHRLVRCSGAARTAGPVFTNVPGRMNSEATGSICFEATAALVSTTARLGCAGAVSGRAQV
jgi:hypothetical protein